MTMLQLFGYQDFPLLLHDIRDGKLRSRRRNKMRLAFHTELWVSEQDDNNIPFPIIRPPPKYKVRRNAWWEKQFKERTDVLLIRTWMNMNGMTIISLSFIKLHSLLYCLKRWIQRSSLDKTVLSSYAILNQRISCHRHWFALLEPFHGHYTDSNLSLHPF